ncbi:hypothetical protein IWQ60_004144, partial [Tieghemiomyces parasiticus]
RYRALIDADATGVAVMDLETYIHDYHPNDTVLHNHFLATKEATAEEFAVETGVASDLSLRKSGRIYPEYLQLDKTLAEIKAGRLLKGVLTCRGGRRDDTAVEVTATDGSTQSIMVPSKLRRNRAVHGDVVAVRLTDPPEASESNDSDTDDEVSSNLDADEDSTVNQPGVIPKVRIRYNDVQQIADCRIVVVIDAWPCHSQYPNGHFVRVLGNLLDLNAEIDAILVERGIAVSQATLAFSPAVLRELPVLAAREDWQPSPAEITRRRDLRTSHTIFSIDPPNCEDIDDALSVRTLPDGSGYELGIHIADVAQFVTPGSQLDQEARVRATTVYLADRRFNMIPALLSEWICSLRQNVDRYAVSVLCTLDNDLHTRDVWYGRTLIRSTYEMEYAQAQALVDDLADLRGLDPTVAARLRPDVKLLTRLMQRLRARRVAAGALELDSTEVRFGFDENKDVNEIRTKEALLMHRVIEEAMVLANELVGTYLVAHVRRTALLRRHPPPVASHFHRLLQAAQAQGFEMDISSNAAVAHSLAAVAKAQAGNPEVVRLFKTMATMAMHEAGYVCAGAYKDAELAHYGLALNYYTHFTSPIRRYADLVAHRQLLALVTGVDEAPILAPAEVTRLCDHLNARNKAAKLAQADSAELFQGLYVYQRTRANGAALVAEGVIAEIRARAFKVWVPRYGIQGLVYWESKDGQVQVPRALVTGRAEDDESWCVEAQVEHVEDGVDGVKGDRVIITIPSNDQRPCTFTYRQFDRIAVSLRANPSRAHRQTVSLGLVGTTSTRARDRARATPVAVDAEVLKGQHHAVGSDTECATQSSEYSEPSMYGLLNQFRQFQITNTQGTGEEEPAVDI